MKSFKLATLLFLIGCSNIISKTVTLEDTKNVCIANTRGIEYIKSLVENYSVKSLPVLNYKC